MEGVAPSDAFGTEPGAADGTVTLDSLEDARQILKLARRARRACVVGGGITGLATAYALEKSGEPCEVRVLEAGPRRGGNLVTWNHNGFTIDGGPDSWVATKPHATRLAKAVGELRRTGEVDELVVVR